jgi:hypothetical protein
LKDDQKQAQLLEKEAQLLEKEAQLLELSKLLTIGIKLQLYKAGQILDLIGADQVLLSSWIARGFIKPTVSASGPGTRNLFDEICVCQILLFQELNACGFNRGESSRLAFDSGAEMFFGALLTRMQKDLSEFANGKRNVLESEYFKPPFLAVFSRKEDGSIETDYILTRKDFDTLPHKLRKKRTVIMPNLTHIARQVHMNLSA